MLGCECQIELPFFAKGDCYNGSQNSESLMLNHIKLVTQMMKNSIFQVKDNTFLLHLMLLKRYYTVDFSLWNTFSRINALFKLVYLIPLKKTRINRWRHCIQNPLWQSVNHHGIHLLMFQFHWYYFLLFYSCEYLYEKTKIGSRVSACFT